MEGALIPGLPDELGLDCLARVPLRNHPALRHVCREWRDLVAGPVFNRHRHRIGAAEDLVFFVQALVEGPSGVDDVEGGGEAKDRGKAFTAPMTSVLGVYNATAGTWHRVSGGPEVGMFAQCAAAGGSLVVVGGWDPATLEAAAGVAVFDPSAGRWRDGQPMAAARSFFACAAAGGRVYVAGGHDASKNALNTAEAYDPVEDEWAPLPTMAEERDECVGVAIGGRFWAVSGYKTESQGRFEPGAEWFDPAKNAWIKEDEIWGGGGAAGVGPSAAFYEAAEGTVRYIECGCRGGGGAPETVKGRGCGVRIGEGKVFVMAGDGTGGSRGWVVDTAAGRWTPVETPPEFAGFVYSAAALRL